METVKARELRLGNYIQHRVNRYTNRVKALADNQIATETTVLGPEHYWEPVPITRDWLENLGFKSVGESYFEVWTKQYQGKWGIREEAFEIRIDYFFDPEHSYYMGIWISGNTNVHIYNVHSLQNLFFEVSGIELGFGLRTRLSSG